MTRDRPPAVQQLLGETTDVLVVASELVPSLREGLRDELGSAAKALGAFMHEFEGEVPIEDVNECLSNFDTARSLLTIAGFEKPAREHTVELPIGADAALLLRALDGQRVTAATRVQEMGLYGLDRDAAAAHVRALEELMRELRRQIPPRPAGPDRTLIIPPDGGAAGHQKPSRGPTPDSRRR